MGMRNYLAYARPRRKLHRIMRMRIIAAGKPALSFTAAGIEEYRRRLRRYGAHELEFVKPGTSEMVSESLLKRSEACYRIALDERGEDLTTARLHQRIAALEMRGEIKTVAFLIGAADGHTAELRDQCDLVLRLSSLTLQHELALLLLFEQLYRIATIRAGTPYHREG